MKPANHSPVRPGHVLIKAKGRTRQSAPHDQSITELLFTALDHRQRGFMDPLFAANMALLIGIVLLLVGGVRHG